MTLSESWKDPVVNRDLIYRASLKRLLAAKDGVEAKQNMQDLGIAVLIGVFTQDEMRALIQDALKKGKEE